MMKKFTLPILLSTLLPFALFAQEEEELKSYWDYHPLHVGGNFIYIGKADITSPDQGNIHFQKANAFAYLLVPINETSYFLPRLEWDNFTMDWSQNSKFATTNFDYLQFALTFLSVGLPDWRWIVRAEYNIDTSYFTDPGRYGLFSALVWGRHQIHRKWHYHIGAFGYTGMEGGQIYPVLGADYSPNAHWTLLAVFPLDYTVQYHFNENWQIALRGRPLKERFRTGPNEVQPRSVFSYSTFGAELSLKFEQALRLDIEVYGGYNFGGKFYIKDQYGNNAIYRNVQGAPYGGISLNWGI